MIIAPGGMIGNRRDHEMKTSWEASAVGKQEWVVPFPHTTHG